MTKRVKAEVLARFKKGDHIDYLAELYEEDVYHIERVIREALVKKARG